MQKTIENPCVDRDTFSTFVSNLRDIAQEENIDIRTIGHQKAMHIVSKALGHNNWQAMKAIIDKRVFMHTMEMLYGFSEAYSDAAWLTLHSTVINGNVPAKQAAINYASRFNISMQPLENMKLVENFGEIIFNILQEALNVGLMSEMNFQLNDLIIELYGENNHSEQVKQLTVAEKINILHQTKNLSDVLSMIDSTELVDNLKWKIKKVLMEA